jgi:hypothetical protein
MACHKKIHLMSTGTKGRTRRAEWQKKVNEAKLLTDGAKATLARKGKAVALNQ